MKSEKYFVYLLIPTAKNPGRNGVKEIPTKIILDFICRATGGVPRPSDENSESMYVPKDKVLDLIKGPAKLFKSKRLVNHFKV